VKRQIRAKQFTQDIIDTLGKRFTEILIPVPKEVEVAGKIARDTQEIIESRATLRDRAKAIALELQGPSTITNEDLEAVAEP
jgi:type I restriction enzyme M protein